MSGDMGALKEKLAIAANYFKSCDKTTRGGAVKCLIKFRAIRNGPCIYKSPLFPICISMRRLEAIKEARKKDGIK